MGCKGDAYKDTESLSEKLDNCCDLKTSDANSLVNDMLQLCKDFNLKILGDCCGTNNNNMNEIAKELNYENL